jgi:TPP-dependent 2-oxoacid decarboxylase
MCSVCGAPGVVEQRRAPLLHHRFGPFSFQREIFERITCASAVLNDLLTACRDIDRVTIGHHRYPDVHLGNYLAALCAGMAPHSCAWQPAISLPEPPD